MHAQHLQLQGRARLAHRQSLFQLGPSSASHVLRRDVCSRVLQTTETQTETAPVQNKPQPEGRLACLKASKLGSQSIQEQGRPLAEYMALPASQYSVLDARMIERISDSTFRCYVGKLSMFGYSLEPVLTMSVTVEQGGCTIRLLSCELQGSPVVQDINRKFTAQMVNVVRWREAEDAGKELTSNTTLEVVLQIPRWCGFLPTKSVEDVGSRVLQNVLNLMVPRFLAQLQQDYSRWASGDTSRKPISDVMANAE